MDLNSWLPSEQWAAHSLALSYEQGEFLKRRAHPDNLDLTDREILAGLGLKPLNLHIWLRKYDFQYCYQELASLVFDARTSDLKELRAQARPIAAKNHLAFLVSKRKLERLKATYKELDYWEGAKVTLQGDPDKPAVIQVISKIPRPDYSDNTEKPEEPTSENTEKANG